MASREQKIENLLKLIKGEINPDDLKPKRLCMAIGYGDQPIYTINEKVVKEAEYWKWAKVDPKDFGTGEFTVTYGEHELGDDEGFSDVTTHAGNNDNLYDE